MLSWVIPSWVGATATGFRLPALALSAFLQTTLLCSAQAPPSSSGEDARTSRKVAPKPDGPMDSEGRRHGVWRIPLEQGGHEEGRYEHGMREGEWGLFTKGGRRNGTASYKADVRDGPWSGDMGTIKISGTYRAGVKHGRSTMTQEWVDGAVVTTTGDYVEGNKHGVWVTVVSGSKRPLSIARSEQTFEHGVQTAAVFWHDNGVISARSTYKDGLKDGESQEWHRNEQLARVQMYRRGRREGLATTWNEDGQKVREETWSEDRRNGVSLEWHKNGQIARETSFADDKEVGPRRRWDEHGKLTEHWVPYPRRSRD